MPGALGVCNKEISTHFCHSMGEFTKDVHSFVSIVGKWCCSPRSLKLGKQHCWKWLNKVDSLGDLSACFAKENMLSTVTRLIFHLHNYILSNSLPRLFLLDTVFFTSCLKLFCSVKWLLHFIQGIWMILMLSLAVLLLSFSPVIPD